jgi:asparagine synthase (glutamine-hydrolysing)
MCGILFYKGSKLEERQFKIASNSMHHRGPDSLGFYKQDDVILSHNRLSIIDISERSNQPFKIEDYIIIFNGEIYNYKELIKDHDLKVKTSSDTEVLLLMFIKYSEKCLDFFNGMFSFVIYKTTTKDFFIARDRLGIKPLYFSQLNGELIVSSEIKAIKKLIHLTVNLFSVRQYKKLRMTVKEDTMYNEVSFFPAGHYMKNGKLYKYWDLQVEDISSPDEEELKWLIEDSIRLRMRSDVPVSSYLSGGLDSTIITALSKPNASWTIGFDNLNEFKWSSIAAKEIGVPCNQIFVSNEEFLLTLKELVSYRNEPLSVPNEVLIYIMTKEARNQGYKVILSGEGADELFWGYDRIFKWAQQQDYITIEGFNEKYCYGTGIDAEVVDYAMSITPPGTPLQKISYYFQKVHLHGLLRRLDNSTMMCSVEGRVPFVDHRLVEFMNSMPFKYKMGNTFKEPLKKIFSNIVPKVIIDRPKMGFPVPLDKVFMTETVTEGWDKWFDFNLKNFE